MKNLITFGVVVASALALAACGGGNKTGNTGKAGDNTAAPATANAAVPAPATSPNATAPAPAASGGATGDATNQNFTIRNNTGRVIRELYVSAVSANNWEEDVLGQDTLANGETAQISFERSEAQCNWDVRVVFDTDQSLEERNVNLCQTSEIEIAP